MIWVFKINLHFRKYCSSLDITINQNVSLFVTVKFISKDRTLTKEIVDSVIEQE